MKVDTFIKKYKSYIFLILLLILSFMGLIIKRINYDRMLENSKNIDEINSDEIVVYITGAVKNPGVYRLKNNSRLNELLNICGGINDNADISKINLAQKLNDSDKINIQEKLDENMDYEYENTREEDRININNASKEELMKLDGIGESTAQKIIEYRKTNYFTDIEEIINVPGIGESKYNKIKDKICVN